MININIVGLSAKQSQLCRYLQIKVLQSLIDKEGQLNQMRLQQHVQYNDFLHVTVLTALNAETMEIESTEKQPI